MTFNSVQFNNFSPIFTLLIQFNSIQLIRSYNTEIAFNSVQFNSFQSNFHPINSIQFSPINSIKIYTKMTFNSVQFNNFQFNFHLINSIQFNIINIQITRPGKIKTVINNYKVTGQNQNLLQGNIQLWFTGQNQLLQWWWWRQNQLTVKSRWWWRLNGYRWRGLMSPAAVDEEEAVSYWWWERNEIVSGVPLLMKIEEEARSHELLRRSSSLLMKRKSRPWALLTGL